MMAKKFIKSMKDKKNNESLNKLPSQQPVIRKSTRGS